MITNLKAFVTPDRIVMGLTADSQRETLVQLIQPLCNADVVSDADQFLEDLMTREAEITTAVEHGIAIPHARSTAAKRLGLVTGIATEKGIRFDPDGDHECRLFFCIAIPVTAPTSHMPLLKLLAKFGRDPRRIEKILTFKTAAGVSRNLGAFSG